MNPRVVAEAEANERYATRPDGDCIVVTLHYATGPVPTSKEIYEGADALLRLRRMALATAGGMAASKGQHAAAARAGELIANEPTLVASPLWRVEQSPTESKHGFFADVVIHVPALPRRFCGAFRGRDAGKRRVRLLDWFFAQSGAHAHGQGAEA